MCCKRCAKPRDPDTSPDRGVAANSWDQMALITAAVVAALYYLPTLLVFAGTP